MTERYGPGEAALIDGLGGPGPAGEILALSSVSRSYGGIHAVAEVDLKVAEGAIHGIFGQNGAGKTTLLDLIAGTTRVSSGSIAFMGRDVTRLAAHQRARLGIVKTFQRSSLFDALTVAENCALSVQRHHGFARSMRLRRGHRSLTDAGVSQILQDWDLQDHRYSTVGDLSHGDRRKLEIALSMALEPKLLLLDEPAAGLSSTERALLADILRRVAQRSTILLIEHDVEFVFDVATSILVMQGGRTLVDGTPEDVKNSAEVRKSYLGSFDVSGPST